MEVAARLAYLDRALGPREGEGLLRRATREKEPIPTFGAFAPAWVGNLITSTRVRPSTADNKHLLPMSPRLREALLELPRSKAPVEKSRRSASASPKN